MNCCDTSQSNRDRATQRSHSCETYLGKYHSLLLFLSISLHFICLEFIHFHCSLTLSIPAIRIPSKGRVLYAFPYTSKILLSGGNKNTANTYYITHSFGTTITQNGLRCPSHRPRITRRANCPRPPSPRCCGLWYTYPSSTTTYTSLTAKK